MVEMLIRAPFTWCSDMAAFVEPSMWRNHTKRTEAGKCVDWQCSCSQLQRTSKSLKFVSQLEMEYWVLTAKSHKSAPNSPWGCRFPCVISELCRAGFHWGWGLIWYQQVPEASWFCGTWSCQQCHPFIQLIPVQCHIVPLDWHCLDITILFAHHQVSTSVIPSLSDRSGFLLSNVWSFRGVSPNISSLSNSVGLLLVVTPIPSSNVVLLSLALSNFIQSQSIRDPFPSSTDVKSLTWLLLIGIVWGMMNTKYHDLIKN